MKAESGAVHAGVGYQVELVCVVYSEPAADVLWYKVSRTLSRKTCYSTRQVLKSSVNYRLHKSLKY